MRLAVLTSDDTRHRFLANALRKRFNVVAVGYQQTGYSAPAAAAAIATGPETDVVRRHFEERRRQETRFFGHDDKLIEDSPSCRVLQLDPTTLSAEGTVAFLRDCRVDALAVYGTSLIRPPLLDVYAGRMLNLHLGLSPYYRGTATNFYPLLNDEPEYVGATVHLIDRGIDSGPIVHQARPTIDAGDMPHTVGCKAILAGLEKYTQAIAELEAGTLHATPQWPTANARLYLRKDYHPSQAVQLYRMIDDGLFARYVARAAQLVGKVRLVP